MSLSLTNCKLYVGGLHLSGDSNSLSMTYGAEMLDDTTFQEGANVGTRSFKPGLKNVEVQANIFWNTDNEEAQFNQMGAAGLGITVAPVGEAEGDRSFFTKGCRYTYSPLTGEVGQIVSGTFSARVSDNAVLVRGQVMTRGVKTASGNSTGINMGSAASKLIYSMLHVTSPLVAGGGGEQFVGIVESDDNSGFTTPTTRLTHTTMTASGSDWQVAAIGAGITDTYWRAKWTISGTTPSFTVMWSFGILAP